MTRWSRCLLLCALALALALSLPMQGMAATARLCCSHNGLGVPAGPGVAVQPAAAALPAAVVAPGVQAHGVEHLAALQARRCRVAMQP